MFINIFFNVLFLFLFLFIFFFLCERESGRRRDRLADSVWTQLSFLGVALPGNIASSSNSNSGRGDGGRAAGDVGFDEKEADVTGGLKRLAAVSRY